MPKPSQTFNRAERRAILAEITDEVTIASVARNHKITPQTLYTWRTAEKARKSKAKAARASAPNGHAAAANGAANGQAEPEPPVFRIADHAPPTEVQTSLDQALADIGRAGACIRAMRDAARKVFGIG